MAWVGIDRRPCPNCGSTATSEVQVPASSRIDRTEREVYLECQ